MAVQAQHPSSFFFLNSNGQEDNNCSLQPQDTHFTFIKAEIDSRKRSREMAKLASMNPPPPKEPPVINNRKFNNVVSIGLRLSHDQSKNQEQFLSSSSSMLPGDLTGEFKRQRDELAIFIQTQGEELRRTLASSRERRYIELLCAAEELVGKRMREKEAELEKATHRHTELEARAAQLSEEARKWQVKAVTHEVEASSLQAHLHQVIVSQATTAKESTYRDGGSEEVEDIESVFVDPKRIELTGLNVGFVEGVRCQ